MSSLRVENLTAGYGGRKVLNNISFTLESGRVLGVLGANGSGKTTLLKSLCGILPHQGSCLLDGAELAALPPRQAARLCSYIPQRSGIAIDLSALDVVLMGFNPYLKLLERPSPAMRQQALAALAQVGLAGRENENYQQLSEGQRQLCILARTLVSSGKLLLLDEPESALDLRFRYRLMAQVQRWVSERQGMAILSLHDPMLALNACHQLLLLKDGAAIGVLCPGYDTAEAMEPLLAQLYGSVTLCRCRARGGQEQWVMLKEREAEV